LQEKIVIDGARGVLINITGPPNVTMHEINEATELVYEMADAEANVIFGVVIDENMHDAMRVTIIATGFSTDYEAEGFAQDGEATPRPRQNPMTIPSVAGGATDEEEMGMEDADQPAILRKREQAAQSSSEPDFESSENPLRQWDSDEEEEEESEAATSGAAVLSDSEASEESAPSDDPYEIPALRRRRRQRFFE
jgi:cell division protein FtsZ